MNTILKNVRLIEKWSGSMDGVLTIGDLKRLFNENNNIKLNNQVIKKFSRGYYVTESFSLESLAARIYSESCITCTTVLAKNLAIGSVPARTVYAVKTGRNRSFLSRFGNVVYFGIAPHLLFGFYNDKGIRYANPEKAFLDTLYFYQKGRTFSINIFSDINMSVLNIKKIRNYLTNYRNPRFITFVKGYLNGRITRS
jgi:hypothetical protein